MKSMVEHHIQKQIIDRLSHAERCRFSELKPDGMESNIFMYHLNQLIALKYVKKSSDKSYCLTPSGLSYADSLTFTNGLPRKQPKLVGIFALRNSNGYYMLAKRLLQPTINTWSIPSGKQHFGEASELHAKREILEQFGSEISVERRGMLDVRISHGDILVSHLLAQVYYGEYDGDPPDASEKFLYEWHKADDGLVFTPGTHELLDALESKNSQFFLSLDVVTD